MKKFVVFSGFLGSGKTTTMMALTKYYTGHFAPASMISNDLGNGVTLADHRLALLSGCDAAEITDQCICYCHDVLTDKLDRAFAAGCELVVSDIPGFGVGALEHVYHGLTEELPGVYELGPFTVLVEPDTVELLRSGADSDLNYIYHTQLAEADLIVLNKCDLLDAPQQEADRAWLAEHYPEAQVLAISAKTLQGMEALSLALKTGTASLRRPDIGYGGAEFRAAMGKLSGYYIQYRALVCCNDFDGTAYLEDMAKRVQAGIAAAGCEIPHMKLLAWEPEGDYGKVDLLGTSRPIEITHAFGRPCTELAVILNASAACPGKTLDGIITGAVEEVSRPYQLELTIFKKDCFGMGG